MCLYSKDGKYDFFMAMFFHIVYLRHASQMQDTDQNASQPFAPEMLFQDAAICNMRYHQRHDRKML